MSCVLSWPGVWFFFLGLSKIIWVVTVCAGADVKQREKGCDIGRDGRNWRNNAPNCEQNKLSLKEQQDHKSKTSRCIVRNSRLRPEYTFEFSARGGVYGGRVN